MDPNKDKTAELAPLVPGSGPISLNPNNTTGFQPGHHYSVQVVKPQNPAPLLPPPKRENLKASQQAQGQKNGVEGKNADDESAKHHVGVGRVAQIVSTKRQIEYDFMRTDTRPLSPLQDWSDNRWAEELQRYPDQSRVFVANFLPSFHDESLQRFQSAAEGPWMDNDLKKVAALIRARMNGPLLQRDWAGVLQFQSLSERKENYLEKSVYLPTSMRAHIMFDREFPLGVDPAVLAKENQVKFALTHSGVSKLRHTDNKIVSVLLYGLIVAGTVFTIIMIISYTQSDEWDLQATTLDRSKPGWSAAVSDRTKNRAFVASMFATLGFSLSVNASIDKFGQIDPSTSTVLIGMTLGNTIGFMLDNMLGSDEGFREYLWSTSEGMRYAIGSLGTARFARYLVTILFDMFFTVILFKRMYSVVVRLAGFSAQGREWIANGFSSTIISFLTFQVYANMTRLEWAYPSGVEDVANQWISGPTMIIAVVTMNIVYLVDESRATYGEKGINDPPVKLAITLLTFALLAGLQKYGVADPSILSAGNTTDTTVEEAYTNVNLRLRGVCETMDMFDRGLLILIAVISGCLGFVIFVTSQQSMNGLCTSCCCRKNNPDASVNKKGDIKVKLLLFGIYCILCIAIVLFFSVVPLWSAPGERDVAPCE